VRPPPPNSQGRKTPTQQSSRSRRLPNLAVKRRGVGEKGEECPCRCPPCRSPGLCWSRWHHCEGRESRRRLCIGLFPGAQERWGALILIFPKSCHPVHQICSLCRRSPLDSSHLSVEHLVSGHIIVSFWPHHRKQAPCWSSTSSVKLQNPCLH
jgi:hypothetical protein